MNRKSCLLIFFIVILLVPGFLSKGYAQDQNCDKAEIMNIPGKWTTTSNNVVSPERSFPTAQYNQVFSRIDKIALMYQQAYPNPVGMLATWYRSINGSAVVANGPVPYQFNSLYKAWYSNPYTHKLMLGVETGTWSWVYINDFGWFMTRQYDKPGLIVEGVDTWLLPKKIGEWKGLPLYKPSHGAKGCSVVLLTHNNQLPYKPISRLQFLQALKNKLEEEKKAHSDMDKKQSVRSDSEEEAAKQKGLENIVKNNKPQYVEQRKASYLKNYKTDQQRKEENIRRGESYFDQRLKPVNDELQNESAAELQNPAIVDANFMSFFNGFTTDEAGGRMLALINNNYFNMQLPKYVPQMIVLYWSWDKNGPAQDFKKHLEENFPIDKLKAMIDK